MMNTNPNLVVDVERAYVAIGALALGVLVLGLSGVIHPRYRSIVVAPLLPLGVRSLREEVQDRGIGRLLLFGVAAPVLLFLSYRFLRRVCT